MVCRFCKRDLAFFKPLADRLSRVERQVKGLAKNNPLSRGPTRVLTLIDVAPTIALCSSVLLAFSFTWIDWRPIANKQGADLVLQSLSIGSPFIASVGLGILLSRARRSAYLLLGLIAGLAGYSQMLLLYALGRIHEAFADAIAPFDVVGWPKSHADAIRHLSYVSALPKHWYWSLILYSISGSLLFLSGGVLGERLRGSRSGAILHDESTSESSFGHRVERLLEAGKPYAAPVGALLAIAGGLIGHK
jgi:hypothetical protein